MVRTLRHRGPDDEGQVVLPGVGLAMRRLSIIDVAGGHQRRWCTDPAPSVSHDRPPGHRGDSRCMIST